jgi:hypothetical protein
LGQNEADSFKSSSVLIYLETKLRIYTQNGGLKLMVWIKTLCKKMAVEVAEVKVSFLLQIFSEMLRIQ